MKKIVLLIIAVAFAPVAFAQLPVKTIPGVLIHNIYLKGAQTVNISTTGNTVLFRANSGFVMINLEKGSVSETSKSLDHVSQDHRYSFENGNVNDLRAEAPAYWTRGIKVRGLFADTALKTIINEHHIFGFDDQGRMIGTRISFTKNLNEIWQMRGLYILDRNTGSELQTLRTDTFFTAGWLSPDGSRIHASVQKSYVALEMGRLDIVVLPFDGSPAVNISFDQSPSHYGMLDADENYIYQGNDSQSGSGLVAYDRRTGKKTANKNFNEEVKRQMLFAFYNNA